MNPFCFILLTPLYNKGNVIGHEIKGAFFKKEHALEAINILALKEEDCIIETHFCDSNVVYVSTSVEELFKIQSSDNKKHPSIIRTVGSKLEAINDYRRRIDFMTKTYRNSQLWPAVVINMGTMGVYKLHVLASSPLSVEEQYKYIEKVL